MANDDKVTRKLSKDMMKVDDKELFLNEPMTWALSDFINEGLMQGDRCIYRYSKTGNESVSYQFLSKIIDCEKNVKNRNFQLIDFSKHYIDSLSGPCLPHLKIS